MTNSTSNPPPTTRVVHRALCPVCGRLAERETHKPSITGLRTSVYSCSHHIWQTQWTDAS